MKKILLFCICLLCAAIALISCGIAQNGGQKTAESAEHKHSFEGEWTVIREATAMEEGRRYNVCVLCGQDVIEKIPRLEAKTTPASADAPSETGVETELPETNDLSETNGTPTAPTDDPDLPDIHTHSYGEWKTVTPPTCTEEGLNEAFCVCGDRVTVSAPALGHNWGTPYYSWSSDNSEVTATCWCTRDESHVQTETVNTTSEITKEAVCTENGSRTYTANFKNTLFSKQKKNQTIPALEHDWGTPDYSWNSDNSEVTATCICTRDGSHVQTETVNTTNAITKGAACEAAGTRTYTAKFTKSPFTKQMKNEEVPSRGHKFGDPTFTWNGYTATATRTCTACGNNESVSVSMSDTVTKQPTCTEMGTRVYTASTTVDGKNYTDTKTGTINAMGHTYAPPTFTWNRYTATATHACTVCGNNENVSVSVSDTVTKQPTCTVMGTRVYTASATVDGKNYTDTKTGTINAMGHTYAPPTFTWNGYTATATRTCTVCGNNENVSVSMSDTITKQQTCGATGEKTYTASFTADGKTYTDSRTQTVSATGQHTYGNPVFTWSSYTATAKRACAVCGQSESLNLTTTNAITKEATCTETGTRTYTASVTADGKTYTDSKTQTISALEHNYKEDRVCTRCGDYLGSCGLKYTLNGDEKSYSVSSIGSCSDSDVYIDNEYNGKPVTRIAYNAFEKCTILTSVTIPDSVTSIGEYAFKRCSVKHVTIGKGVTSISRNAFYECSALRSVTIPDSVTSIDGYAFYFCNHLRSVTIPDSVTTIGDGAFYNCTSLTSVMIPDSVTTIGYSAFANCMGLTRVTIGNGVTSFGKRAFYNCTGLTSVTIGNSVTEIGGEAFQSCTGLQAVNYRGSAEQWAQISIDSNNDPLYNATIVYNYTGE